MRKKQLRKSDIRELNGEIEKLYGLKDFFDKKETVEMADNMVIYDDTPLFFYHEKKPLPTLRLCLKNCPLKQVTVDMGAVKFVTGGADIMRPGITDVDKEIQKNEAVVIVDENNKKPLAVAKALYPGPEILELEKGKALENLHHIGDEIWNS